MLRSLLLAPALLLLTAVTTPAVAPRPVVIAAAGDIACDTGPGDPQHEDADDRGAGCDQQGTAAVIAAARADAVLPLGDEQYDIGAYAAFERGYRPSWGRFDAIAYPVPGNHEYVTPGASGYFRYFGARAGTASKGYYSYDLGGWHFIALNGNCWAVGGCGASSPQNEWLKSDLAAHRGACTIAYWHQPRFSSGLHGSDATYNSFWRSLYGAHATLVLNGHDHLYERFAPQTPDAQPSAGGIREFIVGTGGKSHYPFTHHAENSQFRDNADFGVLLLTLAGRSYHWQFKSVSGAVKDAGTGYCVGSPT